MTVKKMNVSGDWTGTWGWLYLFRAGNFETSYNKLMVRLWHYLKSIFGFWACAALGFYANKLV